MTRSRALIRKRCPLILIERRAGSTIIRKLKDRNARAVIKAVLDAIRQPDHTLATITFENDTEFRNHKHPGHDDGRICFLRPTTPHGNEPPTN